MSGFIKAPTECFYAEYAAKKELVEDFLKRELEPENFKCENLREIMEYAVLNGGKRVRPDLLLAGYELFDKDTEKAAPFACAVEMLHSYSLVHDDLPAMDNDELRRGKPTCHIKFSEYGAILAGDALLNLAFETMLKAGCVLNPETAVKAMLKIAEAAGANGMCAGQMDDMENTAKSLPALEEIHKNKTGALIHGSLSAGAALGGANDVEIGLLEEYAEVIGLIFQIKDDLLDVLSDTRILGKPVNSDIKNNKFTYVTAYGVGKCVKLIEEYRVKAIKILKKLKKDTMFLENFTNYIAERNK
jgi:geranylgeranyl diphosphate synthase type II